MDMLGRLPIFTILALFFAACASESPTDSQGSGGAGGSGEPMAGLGGTGGSSGGSAGTASPTGGQGGSMTAGTGGAVTTGGAGGAGGSIGGVGGTAGTGGMGGTPAAGSGGVGPAGTGGADPAGGSGGSAGSVAGAGGSSDAGASGSGGGSGGSSGGPEWLPSWATTMQGYESAKADHQPAKPLPNNTLRQFVWPTFTGGQVRLQLSNEKGAEPLQVQKVHIALAGTGAGSIDTASDKALTFGGMANVTVPAGQTVWSDGVDFPLQAMKLTAVSIQFGGTVPAELTTHPGSRTTSYFTDGDSVASATPPNPGTRDRWYFINAIEVMAPADAFALAALGDSITDGYGIINQFQRWTDYLTVRIQADATLKNKVSVLNFGLGANNLTSATEDQDAGKDRFKRDVLTRPKIKWVIVLEGVNDIIASVQANTIISAYQEIVTGGRAMGIKMFGSPVTPMGSDNAVRTSVNQTVMGGTVFDAIIDFDSVLRDAGNPNNIATMYNNDGLHPNAAGYQRMAATVNLALLVP
jgi:lysophospholipase L1-like esterase